MSKSKSTIRDKARGLQIQPSASAWPKLEAKLRDKKPNKNFHLSYWLIAASMLGIIILSLITIFTHTNKSKINQADTNTLILKSAPTFSRDSIIRIDTITTYDSVGRQKTKFDTIYIKK